jgi:hypothetical protein
MLKTLFSALIISLSIPAILLAADAQPALPSVTEQQILLKDAPVQVEKPLFDCLKALPVQKVLTLEELNQKRFSRLKDVARYVTSQRGSMLEFDAYVKWMGGTLSSYSKYVEAGSFAAGFARLLPIPYAGQAGQFSKFVSHFALSLSSASAAVKQYLASSQQFIAGVEALGQTGKGKESEMAFLTFYADQQLSRDMTDLQVKLSTTSELSVSALSFLISLQQYLGNTDEYWQKTKSLVSRKDVEKAEKGALAGSIDGLKSRAEEFNKRLKVYDENVGKTLPFIANLVAYDELRQEIESKQ